MEENATIPQLSPEEIRVLGSLIEKSKTTPENYPLTLNALQTACNQKSSRKPVVQYDEETIVHVIDSLKKKGFVSTVVGGGSRVMKYKHNLAIQFPLLPQETAILCLLFLRGPLTAGEINSNSGRLYEFEDLDEVQTLMNKLSWEEPVYIKQLPKQVGQKESRYIHLFGEFDEEAYQESATGSEGQSTERSSRVKELEDRVQVLEEQLLQLRTEFDKLMQDLT